FATIITSLLNQPTFTYENRIESSR
ncbi:hypothetical protein D031_2382B, partial [Vibrio parahaemolyticus VP-48]